jgi:hypothetical protein
MRLTAEEAYNHEWIQMQVTKDNANVDISGEVI